MRNALPIGIGVLVGAVVVGAVFIAIDRRDQAIVDRPSVRPAPVATVPVVKADDGPKSSRVTPTTPDYGPRAAAPQVIYRCRSKGGTSYSNEPCPGGSIVDEASAVSGYNSRPSERLGRLVAEGRAAADVPQAPVYDARVPSGPYTDGCQEMRDQIRNIDALALRPQGLRSLDELRGKRQDIRTRMARQHC